MLTFRTYLIFNVEYNATYDVFLIEDGTENFMRTQNFKQFQPILSVNQETLFNLKQSVFTLEPPCREVEMATVAKCITDKWREAVKPSLECAPFMFVDMLAPIETCTDPEESVKGYQYVLQ